MELSCNSSRIINIGKLFCARSLIRWRLNDWYGVPKNKSPVASRFLYESEFKKSNEVGTLLDNNQAEKVKFSAKDYLIKKYLKLL